jgi:hypothetical protein
MPAHLNVSAGTASQYSQRMSAGGGAPWGIQYHGTSPVQPQIKRANPINIRQYERRLTQIKGELRALKAKYPAASIDRASTRVASAGSVGSSEFKPDSKLFSKIEAQELLREHENIQTVIHASSQTVKSIIKRAQAFRALGTVAAGASVISLGSAVSDLMDKNATSILSDGYTQAEQATGNPSSRSLK